ncbi:hypothetical protein [Streptomyces sp. NPDC048272]|uniref:hypothetical protein n=1 Tax=Streptomyces sp. NPDC048272 TaxID=3154616 RepID=UPI00344975DB
MTRQLHEVSVDRGGVYRHPIRYVRLRPDAAVKDAPGSAVTRPKPQDDLLHAGKWSWPNSGMESAEEPRSHPVTGHLSCRSWLIHAW